MACCLVSPSAVRARCAGPPRGWRASCGARTRSRPAPTGVVRTFDIEARPAELPLIDGGQLRVWAYNGQVPGPDAAHPAGRDAARPLHEPPAAGDDDPLARRARSERRWTASRASRSRRSSRAARSPTSSRPRTPARSGSTRTSVPASRSSAASTACWSSRTPTPPPYTRDVVWVLDDWLLDETAQIFDRFNTPHDLMHDGRWGNVVTVNGRTDTALAARGRRAHPPAPAQRLERRACTRPTSARSTPQIIAVDGLYLRAADPARAVRAGARQPARPRRHASGRAGSAIAAGRRSVLSPTTRTTWPTSSSTAQPAPGPVVPVAGARAACRPGRRAWRIPVGEGVPPQRAPRRQLRHRVDDQRPGVRRPRAPRARRC